MTAPLIKIYNQLYVGFQPRFRRSENADISSTQVKLAFVTPYENNSAGQKRIDTVERWAVTNGRWVPKADGSGQEYIREPKADEYKSVIIDNIPTAGFKLAEDIRRTYWGGGNVVWRIESPLGWEFEISSSNLARIITDCGIASGGEILGKCIFGRMGKDNILIPEGSDLWEKSVKDAETIDARSKTVSANEVVVGSICTMKNGESMTYMGRFYVTMLYGNGFSESGGWLRYSPYSDADLVFPDSKTYDVLEERYHVFKNNGNQVSYYYGKTLYTLYKDKKVVSVHGVDPSCIDQKTNESALNNFDAKCNFASSTKADADSLVFSIEKPVSSKCMATRLDIEYVKTLVRQSHYSWASLFTAMSRDEKFNGSDCTVFLDSGEVVDSMKLFGALHSKDTSKRWGPDVKMFFDKKLHITEDGSIIVRTNRLNNKNLVIKGERYNNIVPYNNDTESVEIHKAHIKRLLENMGPFNLLTFTVTLPSGEILSSQVDI